ncbi:glycoside hydrolase family 43 protein [Cellulomonas sp. ATA003]|uniref:glycoside hydrolase family 43 protein n=1 Tax=Cellulomonas sp. ATA003 TaxID=3073064 RepID=UPI002873BD4A|nr:glycoside hydrolase family 43 protein [Cellulomonas sp. ATA003]WNB84545.1 glycoside hydrolase family 43 protein [Cellulomonas sp. ATA003]
MTTGHERPERDRVAPGDGGGVDDAQAVVEDAGGVVVPWLDDVRGHLTLPEAGNHGSRLTWESSAPDVVAPGGEVTRPPAGGSAVEVDLTVTATRGPATSRLTHRATVRPLPTAQPYAGYLFAHFVGEDTPDGEAIYLAVSDGDTVASWHTLNGGRPVLTSGLGEGGLRDPFIIRSPDGDRFHLLATDLRVYGVGDFIGAQEHGSTSLMIWDSTDLVTWTDQRMVRVSSDHAGNTWAPEAVWAPELGQYVVFWASNLYPTPEREGRRNTDSYNRMMYALTRDFVTFTEPQVWIDVERAPGYGTIDSAVIRHDGMYHRFTKDERPDVMMVFQERSPTCCARPPGRSGRPGSWSPSGSAPAP